MRAAHRHGALLVGSLLLAGCAAYRPAPLTAGHPAHPEAAAAPAPAPSRTLAYAPSDIPSPRPLASELAAAPPGSVRPSPGAASPTVVGVGEVVATVPHASQIVVEHGEIAGFMAAMTMGYRIDPPSLLDGLTPGDQIRFTIDVQRKAIVAIEKLP